MNPTKVEIAVKSIFYLLLALVFCALETSLFARLFPFRLTPGILPFLVAAVAVFDGALPGLVAGLAAGFLCDGVCSCFPYFTILYLVAGAAAGAASPALFKKRFMPAVFWGATIWGLCEFLRAFAGVYLFGRDGLFAVLAVVAPRLIFSVLLSPLAIAPIMLIRRPFRKEQRIFR